MNAFTIYHNPRCSKSRAALALLEENGVKPQVIEYLKTPPTADELRAVLKKLNISAAQLVRKGEETYKSRYAGQQMDENAWIAALAENPVLIERPIVVHGNQAVIGRPPENVLPLLQRRGEK